MIEPRPYQIAGRDRARDAYRSGKRRVLLVAPTGAGKTILFCMIVFGHLAKGGRVLVVVHRRELIKQTVRKVIEAGIGRVGVVAAGWPSDPDAPVQVASIQTLVARGSLPEASLVVFDEAHHYVAEEWGLVAQQYATAKIVGVTATPERGDGTPLGDLFDVLIPIVSVKQLTRLDFLVPCKVIAPPKRLKRNGIPPLEAYEKYARGRKAVVFAASVRQAYELAEEFSAAGYPAACIEADTPTDERDATLERFDHGDLLVLCNCYVLTEGWDCTSVDTCILARGCSHPGMFLRIVGRVLRIHPGKTEAILLDLRGAVHAHGLPDDDRVFSLEGKPISGGDAPIKVCPECSAVIPLGCVTCPYCHAIVGERDAGDGNGERHELTTITRQERERLFFVEHLQIANDRGYRPGWVAHRFQEKFGHFPAALWRELVGRRAA
jgi:DNA repair protein RadD